MKKLFITVFGYFVAGCYGFILFYVSMSILKYILILNNVDKESTLNNIVVISAYMTILRIFERTYRFLFLDKEYNK